MALELPALPYAYDALGPYMSKETLEYHHDKHHMAYVTNGNAALKDSPLADKSIGDRAAAGGYYLTDTFKPINIHPCCTLNPSLSHCIIWFNGMNSEFSIEQM